MGADIAPLNVSIWQLIWGRFFVFFAPCPPPYIKRLTTLSYKVLRTPIKNRAHKKIPTRGPPTPAAAHLRWHTCGGTPAVAHLRWHKNPQNAI